MNDYYILKNRFQNLRIFMYLRVETKVNKLKRSIYEL